MEPATPTTTHPPAVASAQEVFVVDTPTVSCDGGGGPLGHPKVYLRFGDERTIVCPYCSRRFELKDGTGAAAH